MAEMNPDNEFPFGNDSEGAMPDQDMSDYEKLIKEIKGNLDHVELDGRTPEEKNPEDDYPMEVQKEVPIRPPTPAPNEILDEDQNDRPEQKDFAQQIMDLFKQYQFYQMYTSKTENSVTWIHANEPKNIRTTFRIEIIEDIYRLTISGESPYTIESNGFGQICRDFIVEWRQRVPQGGED